MLYHSQSKFYRRGRFEVNMAIKRNIDALTIRIENDIFKFISDYGMRISDSIPQSAI